MKQLIRKWLGINEDYDHAVRNCSDINRELWIEQAARNSDIQRIDKYLIKVAESIEELKKYNTSTRNFVLERQEVIKKNATKEVIEVKAND